MSKLPTAERIKVNSEWKLIGHSHQIADTGDYDGHYEITNGKISLLTKDDDDEALQPIVDALNDSGCKFYQDDWIKFENKMLQEDVTELWKRVKELEDIIEDIYLCNLVGIRWPNELKQKINEIQKNKK